MCDSLHFPLREAPTTAKGSLDLCSLVMVQNPSIDCVCMVLSVGLSFTGVGPLDQTQRAKEIPNPVAFIDMSGASRKHFKLHTPRCGQKHFKLNTPRCGQKQA